MILKSMAAAFLDGDDEKDDKSYLEIPKLKPGYDPDAGTFENDSGTKPDAETTVLNGNDKRHTADYVKKLIARHGEEEDADLAYDMLNESGQQKEVLTPEGVVWLYSDELIWEIVRTCPSMQDYLKKKGFKSYKELLSYEMIYEMRNRGK